MLIATPDYDGSVWVEDTENSDNNYAIKLALDDKYRCAVSYPVEEFNGKMTINFPFGRYYLD